MKKITLLKTNAIQIGLFFACLLGSFFTTNNLFAQVFCNNEVVYETETFGTGTTVSSDPNVVNLTYDPVGPLATEGIYRVIDNTFQLVDWHISADHTPADVNGKMLVVNGQAGDFYSRIINRAAGFPAGFYSSSLFLMNTNTVGVCAPNPLLPVISFKAEYLDQSNNWVELTNSPYSSGAVPQSATPTWVQLGGVFTLPTTGAFLVKSFRITLSDATPGGCGNDFAIDDIKLASCPEGGPVPVKFLNVSAQKKGTGVNISWATGSESNNDYFEVEKSNDGGTSWSVIAKVASSGNSSITKNYAGYDAKPNPGANYYRIKQVDKDGTSKYSVTVVYKLTIDQTDVSVLANPFTTNITVDFLSNRSQVVNSRLVDNTGRQVNMQQINIAKGASRKFIETGNLSRGLYILQVTDENGQVLYNGKLIKQ